MRIERVLKRLFDILASGLGIILLTPLFIIICVLIKATSKGPCIFKQRRIGKNGKTFEILKFRTMIQNAEHLGTGLRVVEGKDDRITSVGRILRKTSLDELPQLINTFCGTMSIVGPRPPATYFPYDGYVNYPEWAKKRFEMRPGITGLAQVTVRNSADWSERIKIDNRYIDEFNIAIDIKILFMTVVSVLKHKGIYAVATSDNTEPILEHSVTSKGIKD